jgi:hypothetical protein
MSGYHRKRVKSYNNPGEAHELTFCFQRLPLLSKDIPSSLCSRFPAGVAGAIVPLRGPILYDQPGNMTERLVVADQNCANR